MAKIIGNTTVTPMTVPDLAQNDKRKADYIKNKKISFLENDVGYLTEHEAYKKTEIDNQIGDIETALDNIIAIQESLIGGIEE